MPRNPEYQAFVKAVSRKTWGESYDDLPQDEEFPATDQEVGWWKQYQFRRAMKHARASCATIIELRLLAEHGYFYPTTPKKFRERYLKEKQRASKKT